MKINTKQSVQTHEGGRASKVNAEEMLRRSVMSCLLWEKGAYEDGITVADRIAQLIPLVDPLKVVSIAREAKTKMNLRHIPLFIVAEMAKHKSHRRYVSRTLQYVIRRADDLTEFLALYWKDGKKPLANKVKQGLAFAFQKFNEYELAKYNRDGKVKLRDVLFMCHSKPKDVPKGTFPRFSKHHRGAYGKTIEVTPGEALYLKVVNNTLETPDTWEVALSGGADKKATFTDLMQNKKLGTLAFIRNLRNMNEANVDNQLILEYGSACKVDRILPYQFIAAAQASMKHEPLLETMLYKNLHGKPKLPGRTVLMVDVSGSMDTVMSEKSTMKYMDAANAIAIILRELCDDIRVMSFSNRLVEVPPRRGFALRDAIKQSQPCGGTYLAGCIESLNKNVDYDRLIVITDEQTHDGITAPKCKNAYIMNVATNRFGVGYGQYRHISGFSASVVDWIFEYERSYK